MYTPHLPFLSCINPCLEHCACACMGVSILYTFCHCRPSATTSTSQTPPHQCLRLPPIASISSINTIQGARRLAAPNSARMRRLPTPTYISSNSLPALWRARGCYRWVLQVGCYKSKRWNGGMQQRGWTEMANQAIDVRQGLVVAVAKVQAWGKSTAQQHTQHSWYTTPKP